MSLPTLDNLSARKIFLDRHALLESPAGEAKGAALLELITRLGFVQLDSINTVARAHDLILFSRRPRYRPKDLKQLYERDKGLFEHWTHDAAVVPMAFYPHWGLRRQRDSDTLIKQWRNWRRDGFEAQLKSVLDHIRDHGPCSSSDVGTDEKKGSGGWWDWHPSKTALEYLWRTGALTVVKRESFRKFYDLTERVIEEPLRDATLDEAETIDWCCNNAMDRLGFATSGELAGFWAHVTPKETKDWCSRELAAGRLIEINLAQVDGKLRKSFARPDLLDDPALEREAPNRPRILSPFDPALRDRNRASRLFGFDYKIEVFVPEAKRKYGYYVFPILEGTKLVGRVDIKAHRDDDRLHLRALWPEAGIRWGKGRVQSFEAELTRIARLAGVSQITRDVGWLKAD